MAFKYIAIAISALSFASCSIKHPAYINDQAVVSEIAHPEQNFKSVTSCAYGPLFFYPPMLGYKDTIALIDEADKAGIKKIFYTTSEMTSYVLFTKYCGTAYGK